MSFFASGPRGLFSSAHLGAHLLRGAAAAGLMYWAVTHQQPHPVGALLAGLAALVALRGCPMCWTVGLIEALRNSWLENRRRRSLQRLTTGRLAPSPNAPVNPPRIRTPPA